MPQMAPGRPMRPQALHHGRPDAGREPDLRAGLDARAGSDAEQMLLQR